MADPLDDLLPRSLPEVSRQLGLGPIEVVRLCGLGGIDPTSGWGLDARSVAELVRVGGVERPWPHDAQPGPLHRLRAVLKELGAREFQGEQMTRMDNTWRGLPAAEQRWLEDAFGALADAGHVRIATRPEGRMVSLAASPPGSLEAFLDGGGPPPELATALAAIQEVPR